MGRIIEGVTIQEKDNYSMFLISVLSEDMKTTIRNRLASVCHGIATAESGSELYCYKNTLKEFLKRYSAKSDDQKKGMIGELLLHILISEMIDAYEINSPFFNTEERNVKKGFDIVLNKKGTFDVWIAESKSGELHSGKNSSQTAVDLISTATSDLYRRLNDDSVSLWLNAINGAKLAITEKRDDREAIVKILENNGVKASDENLKSNNINVILAGTLFNTITDIIDPIIIANKHNSICKSKKFKNVYLIAIQKNTYSAVYDFLESESNG